MKNLLLFVFALSMLLTSCASEPNTAGGFYTKYKKKEGVQNIKLPGWLIWSGSGIAKSFVKDPDVKAGLKLAKKVKKLRFMMAEEYNPIPANEIKGFIANLRQNDFEDLIYVREGTTNVSIMVRLQDEKEKIKDLMILVNEEDQFVFISAKTKIKYQDIADLVTTLLKNRKGDETEKEQEQPQEEAPLVRKKRPQV